MDERDCFLGFHFSLSQGPTPRRILRGEEGGTVLPLRTVAERELSASTLLALAWKSCLNQGRVRTLKLAGAALQATA